VHLLRREMVRRGLTTLAMMLLLVEPHDKAEYSSLFMRRRNWYVDRLRTSATARMSAPLGSSLTPERLFGFASILSICFGGKIC
jgi:hypothetical protein